MKPTDEIENLLPCPFCGEYLVQIMRKANPRASCKTEGCIARKLPVINLDCKDSIDAWNTRLGINHANKNRIE